MEGPTKDSLIVTDTIKNVEATNSILDPQITKASASVTIIESNTGRIKFKEEVPKELQHPSEYPRTNEDPGPVLIFNFRSFDAIEKEKSKPEIRHGATEDVRELVRTFTRLKYNISREYIQEDLTKKELFAFIEKFVKEVKMDSINVLICVLMSHGSENDQLRVKDAVVSLQEIYKPFCECKNLVKIPKFFIIQACKSKAKSDGVTDKTDIKKGHEMVSKTVLAAGLPRDVIIAYSTMEGQPAHRHQEQGSWFIQELCRNLNKYGTSHDIVSILTRTTKFIVNEYKHEEQRQVPVLVSTLRKKCYLTLNRPRRDLLELYNLLDVVDSKQ